MNHLHLQSLDTFAEQLAESTPDTPVQIALRAFFQAVAEFVDAVWGLDSMEEVES